MLVSHNAWITVSMFCIWQGRGTFPCDVGVLTAQTELDWNPDAVSLNSWPLHIYEDGNVVYYRCSNKMCVLNWLYLRKWPIWKVLFFNFLLILSFDSQSIASKFAASWVLAPYLWKKSCWIGNVFDSIKPFLDTMPQCITRQQWIDISVPNISHSWMPLEWEKNVNFFIPMNCWFYKHFKIGFMSNMSSPTCLLPKCVRLWWIILIIYGLAQDCSNSSALALELQQSCIKPSYKLFK